MKKARAPEPVVLPSYVDAYAARLFELHAREWVRLGREELEAALREQLGGMMLSEDEIGKMLAAVARRVRDAALPPGMCMVDDDGLLRR
ncbi:MAG TPA: hypothetical protein PLG21_18645 [Anaerolineae bacterium]|nr:hypothetical protein [Anaerolineae bacterium]